MPPCLRTLPLYCMQEQCMKHQEELLVISHASTIIVSGLDTQRMLHSLIEELKKVIDISWAAITRIEDDNVHFLALSSDTISTRKAGDRIQLKGTAYEWLAAHRVVTVESDLLQESRFTTGKYHLNQGIRSIVYLPLIREGEVTGSITLASRQPHTYSPRYISILERLTPLITAQVENARLYGEAVETARIDELTGLYNRRALNEMIANEIKRCSRYGGIFSLIILDIDTLKNINDTYGHLTGDEYLRQVGSIIKATVRSTDRAFRYGGDEFAIMCPECSIECAKCTAKKLSDIVATHSFKEEGSSTLLKITISCGVAAYSKGMKDLVAEADKYLYEAKIAGKGRIAG